MMIIGRDKFEITVIIYEGISFFIETVRRPNMLDTFTTVFRINTFYAGYRFMICVEYNPYLVHDSGHLDLLREILMYNIFELKYFINDWEFDHKLYYEYEFITHPFRFALMAITNVT